MPEARPRGRPRKSPKAPGTTGRFAPERLDPADDAPDPRGDQEQVVASLVEGLDRLFESNPGEAYRVLRRRLVLHLPALVCRNVNIGSIKQTIELLMKLDEVSKLSAPESLIPIQQFLSED